MDPIDIDILDKLILRQLFPNFKLNIDQIYSQILKLVEKKTEYLSRFDVKEYFNLKSKKEVSKSHILDCASNILFNFNNSLNFNLKNEVLTRLENSLSWLIVFDNGHFFLTKYGLKLFNKINYPNFTIRIKKIRFNRITDLSTFKSKIIIVKEITDDENYDNNLIIELTQYNLKQSKINPWELIDNNFYIKGSFNEIGIIQKIISISKRSPAYTVTVDLMILSSKDRQNYELVTILDNKNFECKISLIDQYIPFNEKYWNYDDGEFQNVRSGVKIKLYNPVINFNKLIGFDELLIINNETSYLDYTILNLFDSETKFKDKNLIAIKSTDNFIIVIRWIDLEINLDKTKQEILKFKSQMKRNDGNSLLIAVEGDIKMHQYKQIDNNILIKYLYIEDPIIDPISPFE